MYFPPRFIKELDKELEKFTTVSICLEHLYPACQAQPDFLKDDDAKLYEMFKDRYSVGVTAVTIGRTWSANDGECLGHYEFGYGQLLEDGDNVLLVRDVLSVNNMLHYQPGSEYTGNEAQAQELVYLVAALVVQKK